MASAKANRGEWGEPYVALRLLGDGKLYLSDGNGQKIVTEWMNILEVIRQETAERLVTYHYNEKDTKISISVNGAKTAELPSAEFLQNADLLKYEILSGKGRTFSVSDELTCFLRKIEIKNLKAKSVDKSDIFLSLFDPRASVQRNNIGFSIKTKFGNDPTLFNTARASAVVYKLTGMTDELADKINSLEDSKGHAAVTERCQLIKEYCQRQFVGFPVAKRAGCRAFGENLDVIDPRLPVVIERMLSNHFFEGEIKVDIEDIVKRIIVENPCGVPRPEIKYTYMVKSFLYAAYCGMTASTLWNGDSKVNGGFITVTESGEVLANYALESDEFKTYLFKNCYLEFPSTSADHGDYGKVYKVNGEYFFNLNFQIRYR